jgi:anti-sigma factor RsiW
MSYAGRDRRAKRTRVSDETLWRRARDAAAPEDEGQGFLDLAAFAEGRLDSDEDERVAALLLADPEAAADVEAARALAGRTVFSPAPEPVIRRALLAAPAAPAVILRFSAPQRPALLDLARWGSLAAAIAVVGWLGFALGSGVTDALNPTLSPRAETALPNLLDPATGFVHDLAADMLP